MHPSTLCSQARRTAPQRLEANWIPRGSQNYFSIGSHLMLRHLPAGFADGRFHRHTFSSSCSTRNLSGKWPTGGFVIAGATTLCYLNIKVHDLPCESTSKTVTRSCRPTTLYGIPIPGNIGTFVLYCACSPHAAEYFTSSAGGWTTVTCTIGSRVENAGHDLRAPVPHCLVLSIPVIY